jgi:hypothetical protein
MKTLLAGAVMYGALEVIHRFSPPTAWMVAVLVVGFCLGRLSASWKPEPRTQSDYHSGV